jgi:polyhydroxybutyrate depolymerase
MMKCLCLFLFSISIYHSHSQAITDSFLIENHYRTFYYNQPKTTVKSPSLVFILHGSGGNGLDMMKSAVKLQARSDSENVILVYPSGYKKFWNECRKAASSAANIENINEPAFFAQMIHFFKRTYGVNTKNVFVVGTSGGGHMAYKLALTMPGTFRAITAIIASLPATGNMDCTEAGVSLPVMIINGTDDPLNLYNGGVIKIPGTFLGRVRSTEQTFQYWSALAGYKGKPAMEKVPDLDSTDGKTIERYTHKKRGKPEVVLLKVIGGKHDYPNDIDVHLEAWNFFKRNAKQW